MCDASSRTGFEWVVMSQLVLEALLPKIVGDVLKGDHRCLGGNCKREKRT